jgi:hypothetical protein
MTQKEKQDNSVRISSIWTTIFTGVCSGCALIILGFIWQMKEDVPKIKQVQEDGAKKMELMQNSINSISLRLSTYSEEQVRQGEKLNFIQQKVK